MVDPDLHHRRSIRLKGFDYALEGLYFVTICAQGHVPLFGEIVAGEVRLNDAGRMVQAVWESISTRFPTIALDAYVIMPDHFHALIAIVASGVGAPLVGALRDVDDLGDPGAEVIGAGTQRAGTSPAPTGIGLGSFAVGAPLVGALGDLVGAQCMDAGAVNGKAHRPTLGDVVGAFKSLTTRAYIIGVRDAGWPPFDRRIWQRNYREHIVRSEAEYKHKVSYIIDNPSRWQPDEHDNDGVPDFLDRRVSP